MKKQPITGPKARRAVKKPISGPKARRIEAQKASKKPTPPPIDTAVVNREQFDIVDMAIGTAVLSDD